MYKTNILPLQYIIIYIPNKNYHIFFIFFIFNLLGKAHLRDMKAECGRYFVF